MSAAGSDLRRVVSSTGVYALAAAAQKGLAFFLLPVYTRYIDPDRFGVLELLTAFSSIVFALLLIGLPSAINKCYHRDCEGERERASILATAVSIAAPVLITGSAALALFAAPVGEWLVGSADAAGLVRLAVAGGLLSSLTALILANLRTQERAVAYSVLTLVQFLTAMVLNITLVVVYGLGVVGVLWGNLGSYLIALPVAALVARRGAAARLERRLIAPMLRFGLLLLPVLLATWIMDLSDRYLLRLYRDLDEVAIYGVGYKFGMVVQLLVVWPFQLAWPAVSFSISHRRGHRETYATTLTYLTALLVYALLGLALIGRVVIPPLVGDAYAEAYRVVPLVALAYAFNGIHFCVSPGVHISGHTRVFPPLALAAAALNLGLNVVLIPRFGMMGAAAATAAAFLALALGTMAVGQRVYPVPYEYGRLVKVILAGGLIYALATRVPAAWSAPSVAWHLAMAILALPLLLWAARFLDDGERRALGQALARYLPSRRR